MSVSAAMKTEPSNVPLSTPLSLTLPSANIRYDELRKKTSLFLKKFDMYVENEKNQILDKQEKWMQSIAESRERFASLKEQLEHYKKQEAALTETMEREQRELDDAQNKIYELSKQKESIEDRKAILQAQLDQIRVELKRKKDARIARIKALEAKKSRNEPELRCYEEKLAMKIHSVKSNWLKFVFTHINEKNWDKEYSFTVDVSERVYKVPKCNPQIENINELVAWLNETRDFFGFLKRIRKAFKDSARSSQ
ncbi:uncharacterized protein VTP21DRAFT_3722 [Calcarisporiella thermophila]|uniref:uncharacterized protein n=1 Tax=Calcarisporiella thermophila TaxID=911321 RepID=UPI0037444E8B